MRSSSRVSHIVYVCADRGIPVKSGRGSSIHVNEIVSALARLDCKVTLLAARMSHNDSMPSVLCHPIPRDPYVWRISRSIRVKSERESSREFLDLARNVELRRQLDKLHRKDPVNFVLERMSLFSFAGLQFARSRKLPYLLEVNSPLSYEHEEHRGLKLKDFAFSIESFLISEADRVIAVSPANRDYAISCGAKLEHITVLPNASNESFFKIPAYSNRDSSPFTIGFVGSLKPWHGLHDLIKAFSIITKKTFNCRLLIVGDGPERSRLEDKARKLGLAKKIEWTGEVQHEKTPDLLKEMDVAVAPYPNTKNFYFSPIKIVEYMASGRAIVASHLGHLPEVLVDGKTALLYKAGDLDSLVRQLLTLKANPALREKLGKNAQASVKTRTWDNNAKQIVKLALQVEKGVSP
jgi:glycosyltransferase involved in cell wall biosynthesis